MHCTQLIKGSQALQLTPTGNKGPEDFEETGQSCSKAPSPHDKVSGTVAPLCIFEPSFCCLQAVWPQETDFPSLSSSIVICKLGLVYSICISWAFTCVSVNHMPWESCQRLSFLGSFSMGTCHVTQAPWSDASMWSQRCRYHMEPVMVRLEPARPPTYKLHKSSDLCTFLL